LAVENERLSNEVARLQPAARLSDEEWRELLRLRGEVGESRRQTNVMRELRDENRHLRDRADSGTEQPARMSEAELEEALAVETLEAGRAIARELPRALQRYAQAHTNAMPADFSELRRYFPSDFGRMTGLLLFQFVRDAGPEHDDALMLREIGARKGADGKWRRVYTMTDGRVFEAASEDAEFAAWESGYGIRPPPPGR